MNVKSSVIDYVKYKQLNWYGHIRRMPEERVPWMQEMMTGMKGIGLEEEDWNGRDEWRRKIKL